MPLTAHLSPSQSAHQAPRVCVEVWVAVRGKALDWATESVCATQATRGSCARAAPTATSERRAPTAASAPVQVKADHRSSASHSATSQTNLLLLPLLAVQRATTPARSALDRRTTNAWTARADGCSMTTSVLVSCLLHGFTAAARSVCCLADLVCLLDIDECGTELARCPSNTYCHNTDGSYECKGMTGDTIHHFS